MDFEQLKLSNQLCFPVYAASRLITKEYQPHLDKLGITYPQYLALMVLWENGKVTVNDISKKLLLNSNTTTPLLKRMEKQGLIKRTRSAEDERKVYVDLTKKGHDLKLEAAVIPLKLIEGLTSENMDVEHLITLKKNLEVLIDYLKVKEAK